MKKSYFLLLFIIISYTENSFSQLTVPYVFENSSRYTDQEIYVGLVGKTDELGDVWMNMTNSQLQVMSADDNTIPGPDFSFPTTWLYPDIFTPLNDLTNNSIQIPQGLYACRIFISFESPMYLHFHETGGYAGANLNSSSDPNDGIRWEIVELTWGDAGLWTNTSRVDAYQYPMGLEVTGFTGGVTGDTYTDSYNEAIGGSGVAQYKKIGEVLSHTEILEAWDNNVSEPYKVAKVIKGNSIDGEPIIEQPSKVEDFPDDILNDYIDEIWNTYKSFDLNINIGDRGTWIGRVQEDDTFLFTDPADGSVATIYGKPESTDAIEGSGFLAYTPNIASENLEAYNEDLMIQAQIAASISRHAIYTNITDDTVQFSHDASRFFVYEPYNEYVEFFHNEEISFESQTYAFAYDDVGDHSSTIQTTFPTEVKVTIGGFAGAEEVTEVSTPTTFTPDPDKTYYIDCPIHDLRLATTGESEDAYTTSTSVTGEDVKWQFVAIENGSWHIQRAAGGTTPRLRTDNSANADMQGTAWSGSYTYYDFEEGATDGTYFTTLPDGPANYKRLQVNSSGEVKMVTADSNGTWESFTFTEVTTTNNIASSSDLFIEAEDYTAMSGVQTEESNDDDTLNIGWIDTNDWLEYAINVPSAGIYTINLRVASPNNGASLSLESNNTNVGSIHIPFTSNWQVWETVSATISLSAGTQTLRVTSNGEGFNLNWLEITDQNTAAKNSSEVSNIAIYPVPVQDQLNIAIPNFEEYSTVEIVNLAGQIISETAVNDQITTVNVSSLNTGFYLIRCYKNGLISDVLKFIK